MESIKHKMDTMINEKDTATAKAVELEAEAGQYQQTLAKFEKEVSDVARKIAKASFFRRISDVLFEKKGITPLTVTPSVAFDHFINCF